MSSCCFQTAVSTVSLAEHFVMCIFFVGFSWTAFVVCMSLFAIRMFAITGFYHRYFSHKTFRTSRFVQCLFAMIGATAVQRGPLWWAAHHRGHHIHSDTTEDKHSPKEHGFIWSHMGWFLTKSNFVTNTKLIRELIRFPELPNSSTGSKNGTRYWNGTAPTQNGLTQQNS